MSTTKPMEFIELEIGSPEWMTAKTASKAAAMMNQSKFASRNQLLAAMKGWKQKEHSDFLKRLFQKGHDKEGEARDVREFLTCEDYPAKTGRRVVDGIDLIASFDGLPDTLIPWEHKIWNETLAENASNKVLEPEYYWQLEHQALVAWSDHCIFTVSDGTENKKIDMRYDSVPERRAQLIAGWKQFDIDLENFVIEAKQEKVIAEEAESFPMVRFKVSGSEIITNIKEVLPYAKDLQRKEMDRELESDQDFANKDKLNKQVKKARAELKLAFSQVENEFEDLAVNRELVVELDSILQKMQSHGERQVKECKEKKKQAIIESASSCMSKYYQFVNSVIKPLDITTLCDSMVDYPAVMRNKKTIESLQNAVDSENARVQIETDAVVEKIKSNLGILREKTGDYKQLFVDTDILVLKDLEDLQAVIKFRIAEHEEAEKERLAAEREKIRKEEQAKADAEAEKKAEAAREKIRQEEEDKAQKLRLDELTKLAQEQEKETVAVDPARPDSEKTVVADVTLDDIGVTKIAVIEKVQHKDTPFESTLAHDLAAQQSAYGLRSLQEDIRYWADNHKISSVAVDDLVHLLRKHGADL